MKVAPCKQLQLYGCYITIEFMFTGYFEFRDAVCGTIVCLLHGAQGF